MNISFAKRRILGCVRCYGVCPDCESLIWLDLTTFKRDSEKIVCHECNEVFLVLTIRDKKELVVNVKRDNG